MLVKIMCNQIFSSMGWRSSLALSCPFSLFKNGFRSYFFICNSCLLGPPLETHLHSQEQYSRIGLYVKNIRLKTSEVTNKSPSTKNKSGPKVLILKENGEEIAMYYNEAEKYAKRNRLRITEVPSPSIKKQVYKFEKGTNVPDETKSNANNTKKLVLRDTIQDHDLKFKINRTLKFLEKNLPVLCIIESSSAENRLGEVSSKIKNSDLKDYIINEIKSSKKVIFNFQKKENHKELNIKTQDNEKEECGN